MEQDEEENEVLLRLADVGPLFGVQARTISRWIDKGKLTGRRTGGGHRRVTESSVKALLEQGASRSEEDTN